MLAVTDQIRSSATAEGRGRRAMLVNSYYISFAMKVIKVSNSKNALQGHSGHSLSGLEGRWATYDFLLVSIATMSLSYTVSQILSLISQNLKRSRDSEFIPFGSNISCVHPYSSVSISTNLKCLASLIKKLRLGQDLKNGSRNSDHTPFRGGL